MPGPNWCRGAGAVQDRCADDVEKCVLSALPGVKLTHAARCRQRSGPSRQLLFRLEARGPLYERMLKAQSMMLYVPSGIVTSRWNLSR
uniref:type VI secretion system baseplate subunit TssK n=1 Tax=Xanthomonas oryzae TaxID=347 RepID=UPI003DA08F94